MDVLLVAVTVTLPEAAGAVRRPPALMVPLVADQLNEVLAPVETVAVHCEVDLGAMVDGLHETATAAVAEAMGWLEPPQPASGTTTNNARNTKGVKGFNCKYFIVHRRARSFESRPLGSTLS